MGQSLVLTLLSEVGRLFLFLFSEGGGGGGGGSIFTPL